MGQKMSTAHLGVIIMVGTGYVLIRGRNHLRYKFTTSKKFHRGDKVWLYFKHQRDLVNVELAYKEDTPFVEHDPPDHFQCDLGDVDTGE